MNVRKKTNIFAIAGLSIQSMYVTWPAVLKIALFYIVPVNALAWLVSRTYILKSFSIFSTPENLYNTPVTMLEFYTLLSNYSSAVIFAICCYAIVVIFAFYAISIFYFYAQNNNKPSLKQSVKYLLKKIVAIVFHNFIFILAVIIVPFLCKLLAAYFIAYGKDLLAASIQGIYYFTTQVLPIIILVLLSISFWFANEAVLFDDCGFFNSYEYSSSLAGGKYWFRTVFTVLPITVIVFLIAQAFSHLLTGISLASYSARIYTMLTKEIPAMVPNVITSFEAKEYLMTQLNQLLPLQISIAVATLVMLLFIPQFNVLYYTDLKTRREKDPYYYDFHNAISAGNTQVKAENNV